MRVKMIAADLVKWVAWGHCEVFGMHGYNHQAADLFIQFHQVPPKSDGTLAANTVPTGGSYHTQAGNSFDYEFPQPIPLSELLVAISTDQLKYTAVGAGAGLDCYLDVSTDHPVTATTTVVGDRTTGQTGAVEIWSNANGPKRPCKLYATNLEAFDAYLQLFDIDAPATGNVPFTTVLIVAGGSFELNWGVGIPSRYLSPVALHKGLSVAESVLPTYLEDAGVAAGLTVQAVYDDIGT